MNCTKSEFKERYLQLCSEHFADSPDILEPTEQYLALATLLAEEIRSMWQNQEIPTETAKGILLFK